ncbi:hypothetical protein [Aureimonas leprariae]|uniref:hypothetical protein n=1 Tax=Plantimonas leprariae TaxID=2615207 RepID=UPI001FEBC63E|nr:hypothetical protein [Aureimonas leprariae]
MPNLPRLYSDNDVAGMIYGTGDDPDAVLAEFMRLLLAEGWDVLGILQWRVDGARTKNRSVEFILAPEAEWGSVENQDDHFDGRASTRLMGPGSGWRRHSHASPILLSSIASGGPRWRAMG